MCDQAHKWAAIVTDIKHMHGLGRPVLIDTLSFARLSEGEPWIAYRQFCQHFLASHNQK